MIEITKLIPGGYGLATDDDGKKIFFWNALPGEVVEEYQITKQKSHYCEAIATRISHPSPFRVEPMDACYLATSPWQIMSYDYELTKKQDLVIELFREHHLDIQRPDIITDGKEYFYRNKMEYALYYNNEKEQIELAFHARGSHRKLSITRSSLERPEIFTHATEIVQQLNQEHQEARRYQSLLLRTDQSGQVAGGLYENHRPHPKFPPLHDQILGYDYFYSPNGFFQINLPVYEMALKEIQQFITTDEVLDLYAGVGTIGLSIARDHHLTLVERDKSAYRELERNAASLSHVTTIYEKSENVLSHINSHQTVIVDPPRAGCDAKLIHHLLEVRPPRIIYLSCNPATEARDVALLSAQYRIDYAKTFNFFPHTPHIENLVILSRHS